MKNDKYLHILFSVVKFTFASLFHATGCQAEPTNHTSTGLKVTASNEIESACQVRNIHNIEISCNLSLG